MIYGIQIVLAILALAVLPVFGYEIPIGVGTDAGKSDFYLVPGGYGRLVLKYASIPLIDFDAKDGKVDGGNWSSPSGIATATAGEAGTVAVRHRNFLNAGAATLVFKDGHLSAFRRDGGDDNQRKKDIAALTTRPKKQPALRQLWRRRTAEQEEKAKGAWWRGGDRLRLGYFNPNAAGTLFAEFSALFAALALVLRRRVVRMACLAAAGVSLVALLMTGSRGSLVALALGTALAGCMYFGKKLLRWRGLACVLAVVAVAGLVLYVAGRATDGRFGSALFSVDKGNVQRLRCWAAAPEMMAAAPSGWGEDPGRAYCDWFQGLEDNHRLYYLVNSHLTWMVQNGHLFRCAYVTVWLMLFVFFFAFARRKASQIAVAVWGTFAVALWFSTVGIFSTLWMLPACCGIFALAVGVLSVLRGGCQMRVRRVAACVAGCILVGGAVPFAVEAAGRAKLEKRAMPAYRDGSAVKLGRGEAKTAILNDATVLADGAIGSFGHELRTWLAGRPDVGAVLIADDPADLPPSVDCLVAAGKGASRYLKHRAAHLKSGNYCHARKTVFLSPPFPPAAVPHVLQLGTDVRMVIGEFASRLDEGFARERPWLKIVPGCELYVPGWTALMLPDENGGGS